MRSSPRPFAARRVGGAAVGAALLTLAAAAPAGAVVDVDADAGAGVLVHWQPVAWNDPLAPTVTSSESGPWNLVVQAPESDSVPAIRARLARRPAAGAGRWVRAGADEHGGVVLFGACPSAHSRVRAVGRAVSVPLGSGCRVRSWNPVTGTTTTLRGDAGWSYGIAAANGAWRAQARWRRDRAPQVVLTESGRVRGVLTGPRGQAIGGLSPRLGVAAAGATDLRLASDGTLAVAWQSPRRPSSCGTSRAVRRARVAFARDLFTFDPATGEQHWLNHAPCSDRGAGGGGGAPVEAHLVGWLASGALAVLQNTERCLAAVDVASRAQTAAIFTSDPPPNGFRRAFEIRGEGIASFHLHGADGDPPDLGVTTWGPTQLRPSLVDPGCERAPAGVPAQDGGALRWRPAAGGER